MLTRRRFNLFENIVHEDYEGFTRWRCELRKAKCVVEVYLHNAIVALFALNK